MSNNNRFDGNSDDKGKKENKKKKHSPTTAIMQMEDLLFLKDKTLDGVIDPEAYYHVDSTETQASDSQSISSEPAIIDENMRPRIPSGDRQRTGTDQDTPKLRDRTPTAMRSKNLNRSVPFGWGFLFDSRYRLGKMIGKGGMGIVHEAFDRSIGRFVAIKLLKDDISVENEDLIKLIREIQITGQLEHPNIMPIYDVGLLEDNRIFFVMKLIRGRTLKEILDDIVIGEGKLKDRYNQYNFLSIFLEVCQAIGFAHSRGVIHRDLKPENVMIGDFGEVQVMDWGLSSLVQMADPVTGAIIDPLRMVRTITHDDSSEGSVVGTPCYMAPEQAQGRTNDIDIRTDIFGLGAILYELMAFIPPHFGNSANEVLQKASKCLIDPPTQISPNNNIPPAIESIIMRALAAKPENRYQTVDELYHALRSYLEGKVDQKKMAIGARAHLEEGGRSYRDYQRAQQRYKDLEAKVKRTQVQLSGHAPLVKEKESLWALEDELSLLRGEMARYYSRAVHLLRMAHEENPAEDEASVLLADVFWSRYLQAEQEGRLDEMAMFREQLERYHRGRYDSHLTAEGSCSFASNPRGAMVQIVQCREESRRLRPDIESRKTVFAPAQVNLKHGHYQITISTGNLAPAVFPITLQRFQEESIGVNLRPIGHVKDGFVLVPAGEVILGVNNDGTEGALDLYTSMVDDFCIAKKPVTVGQYAEFLNSVADRCSEEELGILLPCFDDQSGTYMIRDSDGKLGVPDFDPHDNPWSEHRPVVGLRFDAVMAYCRWRGRIDKIPYRLATDSEWEKAGRGLDGRIFPWGNTFDSSLCCMRSTFDFKPHAVEVGAYPDDCSPYGVYDMAGNVREWVDSWFDAAGTQRVVRGGAWNRYEMQCRLMARSGVRSSRRAANIGFRLAYSPPARKAKK